MKDSTMLRQPPLVPRYQEKLERLYGSMQHNERFFAARMNRESLYHFLKQTRDWSAVSGQKDIYTLASLILRYYKKDDPDYSLAVNGTSIIQELMKRLYDQTTGELQSAVIMGPVNNHTASLQAKALIVDDGSLRLEELLLPMNRNYAVETVEPGQVIDIIIRDILLEKKLILVLNMQLPDRIGDETVRMIKDNVWEDCIPVIAICPSLDSERWAKIINNDVDFVLPSPVTPAVLDASIRNLLRKNEQAELTNRNEERKDMVKILQKEWLRYIRFQSYFSLIYIRLEQLPYLLQTFGSKEVYAFYSAFYAHAGKTIRKYDEIKRWSMNAFVILLPASRMAGAVLAAERIVKLMEMIPSAQLFANYIKIGVIESEHGFTQAEDLVMRIEHQLTLAPHDAVIYQSPPLNEASARRNDRIKLLIVDDDLVAPTILQNHLSEDEWEIEICTETETAVEHTTRFRPNIILSETSMSGINGYALCLQVRQILHIRHNVFVFLSKQNTSGSILRGLQVGADDYIGKPFSVAEVEAKLRRHWALRTELTG
ncbi:response regulator [Paenibacillus tarimensis]